MGKFRALISQATSQTLSKLTQGKMTQFGKSGTKGSIQQQQYPFDLLINPNYRQGIVMSAFQLDNRTRDQLYSARNKVTQGFKGLDSILKSKATQQSICNIFLPPSKTVVEAHSFDYQTGKDGWLTTLQQKGLGGVMGSTAFGVIDEITGGYLQDNFGESLDKRTKLLFQDAEPRKFTYLNTFTFRNLNDLTAFAEVYFLLTYLAYPYTDEQGGVVGDKIQEVVNTIKKKIDNLTEQGTADKMWAVQAAESMRDFQVIKVPPVWRIQVFSKQSTTFNQGNLQINQNQVLPTSTFGPAVIRSIRFTKTPSQIFNQFKMFPNDPVSVDMEIEFSELFPMRRDMLFDSTQGK